MKNRTLSPSDREFFTLVSRAAFTNPFSRERLELDRRITGDTSGRPWVGIRPDAIREVTNRIDTLDADKPVRMQDFSKSEQLLLEHVFLFDEYHKLNPPFDDLIARQAQAGDEPLKVPCATDGIRRLIDRGVPPTEAKRYLSAFYQIRRAFYFINKGLIGQSPSMKKLREDLWNNIFTYDINQYQLYLWDRMEDFSTLLLGPTGCGKGAAAAAIGRSGYIPYDEKKNAFARSFTQTFVSANLSQFAETLLESELFGHARGAFTGAVEAHDGLFTLCGQYGAVFLDEIGDLNPQVQLKLLKVLEERVFSPVGSHKRLRFRGRVIAATNIDLDTLRRDNRFRDDFYYRLCSDCIIVPGLRQRVREHPDELNELIAHTVRLITGKESLDLVAMATDVINKRLGPDYPWPGNVRELAQCIRRVIIKHDYQGQTPTAAPFAGPVASPDGRLPNAQQLVSQYCMSLYAQHGSYEKVAGITKLDSRTVKKYIQTAT
ncbi:MAG: sigma 54-interacting transcriptional regulator [Phycisphaerae bacterium]|nr:sigma 54-interacting transcriptional regulator [Phycisphaerae bacterium]